MAVIKPFKGISYNQAEIKDLGSIITPPYDVISPEEQQQLYTKNPYNIIRLEYGKSSAEDNALDNRYTRAAETFQQWLNKKILRPDRARNYYFHEQTFQRQGQTMTRTGIMAALKLEPYSSGLVLPHELTMAGPKEDRFKLLEHSGANFSPIFILFPDPEQQVKTYRKQILNRRPAFEARDSSGQAHRIWPLDDPNLQAGLTAFMAARPVLIADGHHRYETALRYSQKTNLNRLPGAGYILATLVGSGDPGLLLLPAHRLVYGLQRKESELINRRIEREFNYLDRGRPENLDREAFIKELDRLGSESGGFGYITAFRAGLLVPKRKPGRVDLPVTILHDRLLKPPLDLEKPGFRPPNGDNPDLLGFTADFSQALGAVLDKKAEAAFIIGFMSVSKVLERARNGRLMPRKSTYFYPKLPGGLILYHMKTGGVDLPHL